MLDRDTYSNTLSVVTVLLWSIAPVIDYLSIMRDCGAGSPAPPFSFIFYNLIKNFTF
jgi:hypothetical protein